MSVIQPRKVSLIDNGRPSTLGWVLIGGVASAVLAVVALALFVLTVQVPLPEQAPGGQATELIDSKGELIGTLRGEQKRKIVPLSEISPVLQDAVVAAEDRRFFEHSGLSYRGMLRALLANTQAGGVQQGGSTITQQYARNAFGRVGTERTFVRKLREISVARRLENRYSKEKILEFYLNTIYYGRGAYGAEAAALTYFKKPASDLTPSEAAYMAGAIRAPERFQGDEDPEAAVRIRNLVLGNMVETGKLTEAEAEQARATDLLAEFKFGPTQLDTARAGFFTEHIRRVLSTREYGFTDAELMGGGLRIETSLDLAMQDAAEKAVASVMNLPEDPEVAMVAMDPDGYVRAMIGGRDVGDRVRALGFNFAANVREDDDGGRQAGSALKPVALASYLEQGEPVTAQFQAPSRITIDEPLCRDGQGQPWTVSNFDGAGFGTVDVTAATANSINTVYAQIMAQVVTPKEFIATARQLGIEIPSRDEGCALALGTTTVTPLEMARAFTTFATRGNRPQPIMITRVLGPGGDTLLERSPDTDRMLTENVADTVNEVLQQVIGSGTARGADIGRPAAGKTGTTQNHVDAWFAGYTPDLTAVVWMGYPPDESGRIPEMTSVHGRRVTGGSFPAAIWKGFMQEALRGTRPTDFAKVESPVPPPPPPPACPPETIVGPEGGCVPENP
ncbi:MAG TPA: transglycosylase domain-containing protein, partial [Actinomycetota bacterium]|nr:transglycosylase domain-containing protein [Actinomycetota bacterium]